MIVQPDYFDHWKTRLLAETLGSELAPFFPMRLWIHCQMRRTDRFENMTADTLKAICRWKGDAAALESALLGSGFIERSGKTTIIHDWAKTNARLMHNWKVGSTGGRPKKETQGLSKENPRVISKEPLANPRVSQSRVEKSRVDEIEGGSSGPEWESAKKWLADWTKNGADYTEFETRGAFLALQANGWMWGRNPVADPRAALERQIQTDRQRNQKNGGNGKPPEKSLLDKEWEKAMKPYEE